ncbi:hypothetical protein D9M72_642640 [compost metagenome]
MSSLIARGVPTLLWVATFCSILFSSVSFKDAAWALRDDASKIAAVGTIRRSMKLSWFSDGALTRHVTVRSVAANYRGG